MRHSANSADNSIISKTNILAVRSLRYPIGTQQKKASLGKFNRLFIQGNLFKNAQRLALGFGQAFNRTLCFEKNWSFVARTHILKLVGCAAIQHPESNKMATNISLSFISIRWRFTLRSTLCRDRPGWVSARNRLRTMAIKRAAGTPLSETSPIAIASKLSPSWMKSKKSPPTDLAGIMRVHENRRSGIYTFLCHSTIIEMCVNRIRVSQRILSCPILAYTA